MTTPIAHGYSDFGRTSARADVVYVNDIGASINVAAVHNIGFVGDQNSLMVIATPSSNGIQVVVDWAIDAAFATILDSDIIALRPSVKCQQPLRVKAPYARITINPSAATPAVYTCQVFSLPDYATFLASGNSLRLAGFLNTSVIAGGNVDVACLDALAGPVVWSVLTTAASWHVNLEALDANGGRTTLDRAETTTANPTMPRPVYVPCAALNFALANNDAAAKTFSVWATRLRP